MPRIDLWSRGTPFVILPALVGLALVSVVAPPALAAGGGEASLNVPDLGTVTFGGVGGRALLMWGLVVCALGLVFGMVIFSQLKNLPVHASMREISELIYETCKTYLITQGKFLLILEAFIGVIIVLYFGVLLKFEAVKVLIILLFSLIGIGGSYGVAWFGMRINTFANSRTAFASLKGEPLPVSAIPLKAGMSVGMLLISVELFLMLCILLFISGDYAGPCFIGFAIGESLGAAALRIPGGIFTKIADIGSDLMKIVFNIKEDLARVADLRGIRRAHLSRLVRDGPRPGRRHALVEAVDRHHLRPPGRRHHPRAGQDLHLDRVGARPRDCDLGAGGRRVARHPLGVGGGELRRLLARHRRHAPDGHCLLGQHPGPRRPHGRPGRVRLRAGGLRLPGHGAGDDRGGLLRSRDRQRPVDLPAVAHRADPQREGPDPAGARLRGELRAEIGRAHV